MVDSQVSYAQNGEDVVLRRALGHVTDGRYVDVGANHPVVDSVTHALVQAGWRGVDVEPVPAFADLLRAARPHGSVVQALVSDSGEDSLDLHEVIGTGLSTLDAEQAEAYRTAGYDVRVIRVPVVPLSRVAEDPAARDDAGETHLLKVDVEGAEAAVLRSADLTVWRPWVVVVEATRPMSATQTHETWEPDLLAAGYRLCLFDGLSRFYVAEERAELAPALSYPACPQDGYVRREEAELRRRLEETRATLDAHAEEKETLRRGLLSWRRLAMVEWAGGAGGGVSDLAEARHHVAVVDRELEAMRATLSWRVTAPLRGVRRLSRRSAG